jgi:hypothetical protein
MMDLIIFYSPEKACMTYKIEYPFSHMKYICLQSESGRLVVELNRLPNFFINLLSLVDSPSVEISPKVNRSQWSCYTTLVGIHRFLATSWQNSCHSTTS